ncbi:MAG: double-strand break repair helicase AddA [Rhodospirillaceae bacterium]|nr:double-strand break repair helicase AddA [Rhodospirillaceae bacterium]
MSVAVQPARPDPDLAQRAAASPEASVWVAASAGTGKTKVLTDRVLRLLLAGTAPDRILCLTFTKAAAAEMANRLNGRLGGWATASQQALLADLTALTGTTPAQATLDLARRLFARVLDAPGGLTIETVHAFSQSLLRRFPLESGVAPHFDVLDDRSAAELAQEARDRVLMAARHGGDEALSAALATVTARVGETTFGDVMAVMLRERGRLARMIEEVGIDGAIAATARVLDLPAEPTLGGVMAEACADGAFDAAALRSAAQALAGGSDTDANRGAAIAAWLAASSEERGRSFTAYATAFLTADGSIRKRLATKKVLDAAPDAETALSTEAERVRGVADRCKAVAVFEATAALIRLGAAIVAQYQRLKEVRAVLDYDDQILLARDLLARPGVSAWVLFKLDGGLDHILIDEAQDNSPEQWEIVARLAEEFFAGEGARDGGRTVFAVGDSKQSIFSFQRADPAAFSRMRDHFAARVAEAERVWRRIDLEVSFRSTEAVLKAVDAVFALPEARDGVAGGDETVRHAAFRTGAAGLVELWPPVEPAPEEEMPAWAPPVAARLEDTPEVRLADAIAATVRGWIDRGERLPSRDRPIRAGDVLVLVRRRTPFVEALVRALKQRGIAVAGVDRMVLNDQLAVMDLIALGRFLLLPEDELNLAAVLKGPLVGFDEDRLFALAWDRGPENLWATLRRRRDEHPAFKEAHAFLSDLLARADFVPPYELFAGLLEAEGGRRRMLARLGTEAGDPIDEFLNLALDFQRVRAPSLQGFLHWLESGSSEVKRDLEQAGTAVRVMTVHGAKGLQAPIVFLADTMQTPQPRTTPLWVDAPESALLWPGRKANSDETTLAIRDAATARGMEEYRRLLYVAMTRAEDRLYVCGWRTRREPPAGCWYHLIAEGLRGIAQPFAFEIEARGDQGWTGEGLRLESAQEAPPVSEPHAAAEAEPPLLPAWALRPPPAEPEPPRPLSPSRPDGEEPPAVSPLAATAAGGGHRGRLIHRLLQALPDKASETRRAAALQYLGRFGDLDAEEAAAIADQVLGLLDDAAFAPLFAPGSRAEVPIAALVNGRAIAGQIDRLVVTSDAVMIVDYKTGRQPPEREEQVPPLYLRQMAAYRAALRRIYPDREIRCALLWTEGPRLMPLAANSLDRYAP